MDGDKFAELASALYAEGTLPSAGEVAKVLTDEELATELARRGEEFGAVAVGGAGAAAVLPAESGEQGERDLTALCGNLLATFNTGYQTYGFQVETANEQRAEDNKLPLIDRKTVQEEVEALLADHAILKELQDEIDYFTENPRENSPEPASFDIGIVPEELTHDDEQAFARELQAKINTVGESYIRAADFNDDRTPKTTGKGFRIVFIPRHYNVPSGNTTQQTEWMRSKNQCTTATSLRTATDGEALAAINNLAENSQLGDPNTILHKTRFRRFDQKPVGGDYVSSVCVSNRGRLCLSESNASDHHYPARALVVPKA